MNCLNVPDSSVSHADNNDKKEVKLQWKVPANLPKATKIDFRASVVDSFLQDFVLASTIVL